MANFKFIISLHGILSHSLLALCISCSLKIKFNRKLLTHFHLTT